MQRPAQPVAFTIIELLVVITSIVVILALLTPALDTAVNRAEIVRCGGNQHGIGVAIATALADRRHKYDLFLLDWSGLLGERTAAVPIDVTQRPLNAYLGYTSDGSKVPIAQCPSDRGDALVGSSNTYAHTGTSYVAWMHDYFRVKQVFAAAGFLGINSPQAAVRHTSLRRTDNKIIVGEWATFGDRSWDAEPTRWHVAEYDAAADPNTVERKFNTLFADGHVEFFGFPRAQIESEYGWAGARPDDTFKWW